MSKESRQLKKRQQAVAARWRMAYRVLGAGAALGMLVIIAVVIALYALPRTPAIQEAEFKPWVDVTLPRWQEYAEKLETLIRTHPAEEIRHDLHRLIAEREVYLDFEVGFAEGSFSVASFGVVDRRKSIYLAALLRISPSDTRQLVPEFHVDHRAFGEAPEWVQLVVYHEYQHYLQWQTGTVPAQIFQVGYAVWHHPEAIREWFLCELNAYELECQLAHEHGWGDKTDTCRSYEVGGRSALAAHLADKYQEYPHFRPYAEELRAIVASQ
ncbi:MAG: hypothetical protein AAB932_04830 [Patescibacteria group bacterium]